LTISHQIYNKPHPLSIFKFNIKGPLTW